MAQSCKTQHTSPPVSYEYLREGSRINWGQSPLGAKPQKLMSNVTKTAQGNTISEEEKLYSLYSQSSKIQQKEYFFMFELTALNPLDSLLKEDLSHRLLFRLKKHIQIHKNVRTAVDLKALIRPPPTILPTIQHVGRQHVSTVQGIWSVSGGGFERSPARDPMPSLWLRFTALMMGWVHLHVDMR